MADAARTTPHRRTEELPLAARRHRLVAEVARRLASPCGVPPGARVAVGVSGGSDSVALLLAAAVLRHRRHGGAARLEPLAVHVNHHLRESADDDETFVIELCREHGIDLHVRHVHPGHRAGNVQANARALRYEAIGSSAASAGAAFVAVAHHAEDQLETMLMALGRGAGLDGLSGMAWSRPLADELTLVRPLLAVRKGDCEDFCRAAGVTWRDDPTNADPNTVRGRLRRDVLGVLEELWPDVSTRATGTADLIAAARTALDEQLTRTFGGPAARRWDRDALRPLRPAVVAAVLRRAAVNANPRRADDLGQTVLGPVAEAIADTDRRPRSFDWPGELRVLVTAREVRLEAAGSHPTEPK